MRSWFISEQESTTDEPGRHGQSVTAGSNWLPEAPVTRLRPGAAAQPSAIAAPAARRRSPAAPQAPPASALCAIRSMSALPMMTPSARPSSVLVQRRVWDHQGLGAGRGGAREEPRGPEGQHCDITEARSTNGALPLCAAGGSWRSAGGLHRLRNRFSGRELRPQTTGFALSPCRCGRHPCCVRRFPLW